jgi:hypothetical protein
VNVRIGYFYEFMRGRNVARAGQPVDIRGGVEIGRSVTDEDAFRMVRNGKDVYTPNEVDAYRLAARIDGKRTKRDPIHRPTAEEEKRSGRDDIYFPHYHPGRTERHESDYGHIFFGHRGQAVEEKVWDRLREKKG